MNTPRAQFVVAAVAVLFAGALGFSASSQAVDGDAASVQPQVVASSSPQAEPVLIAAVR